MSGYRNLIWWCLPLLILASQCRKKDSDSLFDLLQARHTGIAFENKIEPNET